MAKVLLLNDTSHFHCGCQSVIKTIREALPNHDISTISSKEGSTFLDSHASAIDRCDVLVVNGEGTLHHNHGRGLLQGMQRAVERGTPTFLVNSVWDTMPSSYAPLLNKLRAIQVREVASQKQLKAIGVDSTVIPDLSWFRPVLPPTHRIHTSILIGDYHFKEDAPASPEVHVKKQTWDEVVEAIHHADVFLTGRHHGVYAACKAKTPFVANRHNCHKITGLFDSAGVVLPISNNGAEANKYAVEVLDGTYDDEYSKLWAYLDSFGRIWHPPWEGQF